MKAISFVLLIFMLVISVIPGNAKSVVIKAKKDCCQNMAGMGKNQHHPKECSGGMCVTVLSCNNCCFVKTEQVKVSSPVAMDAATNATPYLVGNLSGYTINCWNPPKV
ncbi:hypothetical protein [Mucilaginibacter flavus]|uniref:hypothetical protein n=1 Tax=Mucilaginibacter flavus TaxID=931504 RepID=UPI0025B42965|nr:hypothetical protein [Mucilaginibacter flavus]MDN3584078.1 hypothetical protein [Mucilaginibacter flavus]